MTREEILSGIEKTEKVINNPSIPEAVKQVAMNTREKLQSQLNALGSQEPKIEKEEAVEPEGEEKPKAEKKEKVKFERKPRTPKAPKKEDETESDESKAEKSMEGKKLTVANCRELLSKLKSRREGAKKRIATRKKQGKPAELTTIEALKKASDNLEKKVETEVNKEGKLQKTTIKRSTKEVVDIVATIISGIPTKAERTSYINEVIADLKKLIDKVEPITEKMARGGNVYSSENLYIVKVYDGKTGDLLDMTKRVWAKNLKKAEEIAMDEFEDDMKEKYGDYLNFKVEEAPSMFAEGGILDEESKYEIDNGFTKKSMNDILKRLFPDNFGFKVFKPVKRQAELMEDFDEAPSSLYGYDDKDIKSKLYFSQYKRDHDINYKVTQGGENTYFTFGLNDEEGNEYLGTFGFKDRGDVDSSYITRFIAFLMECYGLPFQVKHSVE